MPIFARERIVAFKHTDWVKVTGTIDFRERNGSYFTVLLVSSASDVVACPPHPNPQQWLEPSVTSPQLSRWSRPRS